MGQVIRLLAGYGVTPVVECTGGNVTAVTVTHGGYVLAITDNGAGTYTQTGWDNGADPITFDETTSPTRRVFYGMAQFARVSGWRK